jgi:hypothetical protein
MTKQEKEMYLNKKAIAVYPMTNHGGIEILDIFDDYVVYRFNFGTPDEAHRSKIRYGASVESFKTYAGYSIRLNDCMRA